MSRLSLFIAAMLVPCVAGAAEKTISGKVSAVDAARNTITIGDPDLDENLKLEVSRKTEIHVDGKKEPLTLVKKGQFAEVTYDDKLEIATTIVANNELNEAAETEFARKKAAAIRDKLTGCYAVSLVRPQERRDFFVNVWPDTTVKWDGQQIGTWDASNGKLTLTFVKPEMKGRVKFAKQNLIGELTDPQKHAWKVSCTRLYSTKWDLEGPLGRRVMVLWSNGRIDRPDNKDRWVSVGNKIDLIWSNGFTDSCMWSADKRRFEGKNRENELISGKLIEE